jgi:hypothetical protein
VEKTRGLISVHTPEVKHAHLKASLKAVRAEGDGVEEHSQQLWRVCFLYRYREARKALPISYEDANRYGIGLAPGARLGAWRAEGFDALMALINDAIVLPAT